MERKFVSAFVKWGTGVLLSVAVLCIVLAAATLFFPEFLGKILLYTFSTVLLLAGVGVVVGLFSALLRGKKTVATPADTYEKADR